MRFIFFICCFFYSGYSIAGIKNIGQLEYSNETSHGSVLERTMPDRKGENYDYAPTVMREDGIYKMWWLGRTPSLTSMGYQEDSVRYSTSSDGYNWSKSKLVLKPVAKQSGQPGFHVGNPSVIKVNNIYHMYFSNGTGGVTSDGRGIAANNVGYATSTNGEDWKYNGNIVTAFIDDAFPRDDSNIDPYGAGLPSVVFKDGFYYMMYNDTTGKATQSNGAGVYLIRSPNANFSKSVDVFNGSIFVPMARENKTAHLFTANVFGGELSYSPALELWVLKPGGHSYLKFFNEDFRYLGQLGFDGPGLPWREEDTYARTPEGHLIGDKLPLNIRMYGGYVTTAWPRVNVDYNIFYTDIQLLIVRLGLKDEKSKKHNSRLKIMHASDDCGVGYQRIAFLGSVFISADSVPYYKLDSAKNKISDWAVCSKTDDNNKPLVLLKHYKNDCPSDYTRVAWIGGVHAGADGDDFSVGRQNWALCSKVLAANNKPLVLLKHFNNGCPGGYSVEGLIAKEHAGADGYHFKDGPQDWYICVNQSPK